VISRRVLVTGASKGIGAALAGRFLDAGALVVGCGRAPEAALQHDRFTYVSADVTDERAVRALFATVRERLGGLDVLVNNAGAARMNLMALTPSADARGLLETNVLGTFHCTQQAVKLLRRSSAGRIVNVTTVAVPLRLEGEAMYAASKAAVESFTRVVAREVGPLGITCNAVGPSPIRTDLIAGVPAAKLEALVARQAVPAWATADDVYNVVEFFTRAESRHVTGQIVYLGGMG
jgi:3-oxoacyl-[acyl-carrier protein] reductase